MIKERRKLYLKSTIKEKMKDKIQFQETAQKLIDYDAELRDKYQYGEYDVERCPKGFCAHRKLLVIVVVVNILYILIGHTIPKALNVIFFIVFIFMYRSYQKKVEERDIVLYRREQLLNSEERMNYIKTLKQLANKHPEWDVEPWWEVISGMDLGRGEHRLCDMHYFALPLVSENERGRKYIEKEDCTVNVKTGTEINSLLNSSNYYHLNVSPTIYEASKEYAIAALFFHWSSENEVMYTQKAHSYEEVNNMMNEYSEILDEKERKKNYWEDFEKGRYETNEEKHRRRELEGGYNFNEDVDDWFERNRKEERYRTKLENDFEYESYIDSYDQYFYQVGWIIFNKEGVILDILLNKQYGYKEKYATYTEDFGEDCRIKTEYKIEFYEKQVEISTYEMISKLSYLKLDKMDYTSKRPDEFTLKEWAAWIYAHSN